MKRLNTFILLFTLLFGASNLKAQELPKHEMRAAWMATIWGLDWPSATIPSTGSSYYINLQKDQFIYLLDELEKANINTLFFQVRSECDAMYQSSYEPWSAYLVTTRGLDPGYDPLEFAISECHKRGIELHAWLNPYRFESFVGKYEGKAGDYRESHPEWVLEYPDKKDGTKNISIIDPGNPEVRQRIVDVVSEIVTNYDVDGITFDDYFYAYGGTPNNLDAYAQQNFKPADINLHDWRRDNVNRMVADVYAKIQELKPWVTFGLSPFGIWTTDNNVAEKEGIELPAGISGSNMYQEIYCDPVAWLKEGTVDYISPQLYWPTTSSGQDYDVLGPWWSDIANRFHRHFYSSNNLYDLTPTSYASTEKSAGTNDLSVELNGLSMLEYLGVYNDNLKSVSAQHPTEIGKQVAVNRKSDKNGAPGSVMYRTKNFTTQGFVNYLKQEVFKYPALAPAINWKPAETRSIPENIRLEGNRVKWDSEEDNVRFVVYAIPQDQAGASGNFSTGEHILGISYSKQFDLAEDSALISTHTFAVSVLDRYGNEFPAGLMNPISGENQAVNLLYPTAGEEVFKPFVFSWDSVENAELYIFEVASDSAFNNTVYKRSLTATEFDAANISMAEDSMYYWRVSTRMAGVYDTVSVTESFLLIAEPSPEITSPVNGEENMSLTPTITWTDFGEGFLYRVQISYQNDFSTLVVDTTGLAGQSWQAAENSLHAYGSYFVRVIAYNNNMTSAWSDAVAFSTIEEAPDIPVILSPTEDENISAQEVSIKIQDDARAYNFRLELSKSSTFPWTDRKVLTLNTFEYEGLYTGLTSGTYYVRARASYNGTNTEWSETRSFNVILTSAIDQEENGLSLNCATLLSEQNAPVVVNLPRKSFIQLKLYDTTGRLVMDLAETKLPAGVHHFSIPASELSSKVYLLSLRTDYGFKTLKLVK
ncbi:family 10 glycosylhydrolase [Maribellus sediminis]|uniref:family 10 glycosylhydrolase n=1 Tax=Maribellus sediminis TaxID=2696285 RepID=UPI00143219D9|nr:family 10 glycosylhydrolase [Maribellus sediminis]